MIRRIILMFAPILFLLFSGSANAQEFPERPVPPRLVNDFAGILNSREINTLETKLVAFDDSSSTQIAIVTIKDLHGYDVADYAQRLAEKWGIGQQGLDNGILILVKPKTGNSQGQIAIENGYGLEGIIPDITSGEIIDYEMIPSFRNNDYYGGLDKATNTLMALARGEFPANKYRKGKVTKTGGIGSIIFIIVILIILMASGKKGGNNRHISNKGLPLLLLLSMMNSGRSSHGGSWGGFSGGGGGGGFGGFGGGSFGGGGASGSW